MAISEMSSEPARRRKARVTHWRPSGLLPGEDIHNWGGGGGGGGGVMLVTWSSFPEGLFKIAECWEICYACNWIHFMLSVLKVQMLINAVQFCRNYRTWILMSSYGFSFGIELTADNVLASYFGDHFGLAASHAGDIAAVFGLINFVSRPLGQPSTLIHQIGKILPILMTDSRLDTWRSLKCRPEKGNAWLSMPLNCYLYAVTWA